MNRSSCACVRMGCTWCWLRLLACGIAACVVHACDGMSCRRSAVYNERFDMSLDLRQQQANITLSVLRRCCPRPGEEAGQGAELIGQVRLNTSTILASIASPVPSQPAAKGGGFSASAATARREATCEGWYDLCLRGRPVHGPDGVAGLHIRVTLANIPLDLSLASGSEGKRAEDARTRLPELVLVPQHMKDAHAHKPKDALKSKADRKQGAAKAFAKDGAASRAAGHDSAQKLEQQAQRRVEQLLSALPRTRAAAAAANEASHPRVQEPAGDTESMLCTLQAENHRLAQELLLLRRQQQQPVSTSREPRSPVLESPLPSPGDGGGSISSKNDTGASKGSDAVRDKSKSDTSNADKQRLSASRSSTDTNAVLDADILRALLHWGQALHRIRPKIGPGDALYSTIEWLVQEHAKLMRLVSAAVAPRCTSITELTASSPHSTADSEAASSSSQQAPPLLVVPHSDCKPSDGHEDYRIFSSLVRVPVERPGHRFAHSSRSPTQLAGATRGEGSSGGKGGAPHSAHSAEPDVSGDLLASAADSHISEVSRCVRGGPPCRVRARVSVRNPD